MNNVRGIVVLVWMAGASAGALAAGGPESIALVVNADSDISKRVANEYVYLRNIPARNVIYLTGVDDKHVIGVEAFRRTILTPVFEALRERDLAGRVDCVTYSAGFPYAVDVNGDLDGVKLHKYQTQPASITGLTYLHEFVTAKRPQVYLSFTSNGYMRRPVAAPYDTAWLEGESARLEELGKVFNDLNVMRRREAETEEPRDQKKWRALLDRAEPILDDLLVVHPKSTSCHYNLACILALGGKADEAIVALRRSVECGWYDVGHSMNDPDLESLRERDDFKELVKRMGAVEFDVHPTRAFRSAHSYGADGSVVDAGQGASYMLSTMLAHVSDKTNTVAEALWCLRRAAAADATRPLGTIYLMRNGDVRSRTRHWAYHAAAGALEKEGVRARIVDGVLPKDKGDVMGVMTGRANFEWSACGSTILPGAICEHLTSTGGCLRGSGQTLLTKWIAGGASGSSGAVTEPYALPHKFPHAFMHVHYARGATLAEAFYQSLHGPYQLLVVGDPLCAPWARPPAVEVEGLREGRTVRGDVRISPVATYHGPGKATGFDVYVDGKQIAALGPGETHTFATGDLADGHHELRVVGAAGELAWEGSAAVPFVVSNAGRRVETSLASAPYATLTEKIEIRVSLADGASVQVRHNERVVATVDGGRGTAEIDARVIGGGKVRLDVVGTTVDGHEVRGESVEVTIVD